MGKSSQVKGRHAELELVRVLQENGIPAEPGQAVSYGCTPDITGVAARFGDGLPAVFHRRNREGWRVTMPLTAWLELYQHHRCQCGGHCNRQKTAKTGGESDIDP